MNAMLRSSGLATAALVALAVAGATAQTATTTRPTTPGQKPTGDVTFAPNLVNKCANIRYNDLVMINGGTQDQQLLEEIAIEVRKLGAHPLITTESENLIRRMYADVPAKFDAQERTFGLKLAELIDAIITVDIGAAPDLLAQVPSQRLTEHTRAEEQVMQRILERGVVQVHLGNGLYPTKTLAQQFGIPQEQLSSIFWKGVNTDYDKLQQTGQRFQSVLATGRELRITAPNGTDLKVQITSRPVYVSDGVVSSEERYAGGPACQAWLPAGEVYVTPVPDTAEGTFVADTFYFQGKLIEGLTMKFSKGKMTGFTAKGDIKALQDRFNAAPPGRELFAAVDIGINPDVQVPANSKLVTWTAAGTVSVGVGNNVWAGGDNAVPFDFFAHLNGSTVTVDGTKIVDAGKLATAR
jgi:leucyl aminopeptidase (aminopeptidase T)